MIYKYETTVLFRYDGKIIGKGIFVENLTAQQLKDKGLDTSEWYNGGYVF